MCGRARCTTARRQSPSAVPPHAAPPAPRPSCAGTISIYPQGLMHLQVGPSQTFACSMGTKTEGTRWPEKFVACPLPRCPCAKGPSGGSQTAPASPAATDPPGRSSTLAASVPSCLFTLTSPYRECPELVHGKAVAAPQPLLASPTTNQNKPVLSHPSPLPCLLAAAPA